MKLILLGYMASGKSFVGAKLAQKLSFKFIDLDDYITEQEGTSIKNLFDSKGELYFRKAEKRYLNELMKSNEKMVIALGGGTPCYYNTMDAMLNTAAIETIYLKVTLQELVKRVSSETHKRPLISHLSTEEALKEFIGKHLFERSFYYNKAKHIVDANTSLEKIIEDIISRLF